MTVPAAPRSPSSLSPRSVRAVDAPVTAGADAGGVAGRIAGIPSPHARPAPADAGGGASPSRKRHTPVASTNDLKNGMVLNLEGQLWSVVEFQHVKPGKGPAFVRTKLKSVRTGKVVDKTFNAGTKVDSANVDRRTMQYLYNDGTDYIFMDPDTFDQVHVPTEVAGDAARYLLENNEATIARHDGEVLYVELPTSVVLEITYAEPGLQGDRSTGGTKPATVETGAQIQVPLFVEQGTRVKVDTRDGSYLGRVS